MLALKMIVLILPLGIDTLIMSISLGSIKITGRYKIAFTFASAEMVMPLVGILLGKISGQLIGHWALLISGMALVVLGGWIIFFDNHDGKEDKVDRNLVGWALITTSLSVSLDELAVGFSFGVIGVPVALTIFLVGLQAFVLTYVGITFGLKLKRYLGEWAERLVGILLGILGIWILVEQLSHSLYN